MNWLYSLRTRLIILYTGVIVAGFGGLALWAGRQIETAAQEDFEQRTESEVTLVARALGDSVENYLEGELRQEDVARILDNYARETGSELTLINNQGRAWLSTTTTTDVLVYLSLPEITAARENRITHETRRDPGGKWMIYAAAPLFEEGRLISIVQLAVPVSQIEASIQQRWVTLGLGFAALGILVIGISIVLSTSLTRPLARLRQAAQLVAQGDFSARVPDHRRDEIGQVARTFNTMSEQVQAMLEEQRAFASNASHELRTPLTTIGLRVEALMSGSADPERQARYLREITTEIERMKNLVEDLILLSRFDAGSVEIGRDSVDMPRFARQLLQEMQPHAQESGITLSLTADDSLPAIQANLTHLHVVYRNILDNAIKYMSSEGGRISWQIQVKDGSLLSTITDTGRGIEPHELARVLERFYRADKSHSRSVPGAGLGLSLVVSIVETYGGCFSLDSQGVGTGTTATVAWPISARYGHPGGKR